MLNKNILCRPAKDALVKITHFLIYYAHNISANYVINCIL